MTPELTPEGAETGPGGDLIARLKAGLDEDEAAAKAVTFRSRFMAIGNSVQSPGGPGHPPMPLADVIDAETAAHIARQDPARTLREVAAKRAILDDHRPVEYPGYPVTVCLRCADRMPWPCNTVRAMAAVYDSPGSRPAT